MSEALSQVPAVPPLDPCIVPDVSSIPIPGDEERGKLITKIKTLLKERDAVIVSHYYTDSDLQLLAEETGGHVSDSLDMARFGHDHPCTTLLVAGVRFMGETAKILNPEKRVLMPSLDATCSLDLSCPAKEFNEFCDQHPDRIVVVYANTSAEVKARADWVVTSSIAARIITHLHEKGEKIIWAPDKHLGAYVQRVTGADMLLWQGTCIVHEAFRAKALSDVKKMHPEAAVLVHPESPLEVIELADFVGSTSQLIQAAHDLDNPILIVATDNGIFYKMKQVAPDKIILEAPTVGEGATCVSCAHCPWMAINTLQNLADVLENCDNEIHVDEEIRVKALRSTKRMMDFAATQKHRHSR